MDENVKQLLEALKKVNNLMTEETLKKASTEQLLEYNEQINRIKAILLESI